MQYVLEKGCETNEYGLKTLDIFLYKVGFYPKLPCHFLLLRVTESYHCFTPYDAMSHVEKYDVRGRIYEIWDVEKYYYGDNYTLSTDHIYIYWGEECVLAKDKIEMQPDKFYQFIWRWIDEHSNGERCETHSPLENPCSLWESNIPIS